MGIVGKRNFNWDRFHNLHPPTIDVLEVRRFSIACSTGGPKWSGGIL